MTVPILTGLFTMILSGANRKSVSYYLPKILDSIGITGQREQTRLNGIVTTVNASYPFSERLCCS